MWGSLAGQHAEVFTLLPLPGWKCHAVNLETQHSTTGGRGYQHAEARVCACLAVKLASLLEDCCLPGHTSIHLCLIACGCCFLMCRFGGNPVCSAGGRAVLRVIEKEGIQQHAAQVCRQGVYTCVLLRLERDCQARAIRHEAFLHLPHCPCLSMSCNLAHLPQQPGGCLELAIPSYTVEQHHPSAPPKNLCGLPYSSSTNQHR